MMIYRRIKSLNGLHSSKNYLECKILFLKRYIRSGDSIGDPTLVIFSEGSQEAFETCACAQRRLSNGKHKIHLIAAKGIIVPVKKISVMRLKLNGATRLRNFNKEESRLKFKEKNFMMDSKTVKAMLQKGLVSN